MQLLTPVAHYMYSCIKHLSITWSLLGQFKMGAFWNGFPSTDHTFTVFFFSATWNDQNCKSNELYLFWNVLYFLPLKKKINYPTPPKVSHVRSVALEIQLGHRLQEFLLSFLCSQLQHFLWVACVQLRLADGFHLRTKHNVTKWW